jgi:general secretion pathway protein K
MVSDQLAEVCYDYIMRREYQRGIALISVLWITTLLAVIAASFASSARTQGQLARNMVENAKAEALADGAVHRAVLGILEMEPERAWRTDGRPYRLDYGGGSVVVRVFDEDSKIDLNAAPAELLGGLFLLLGLDEEQAETLADRIVDFRDEDDEPEPNGAEDPDYEEAGRADGALDRPLVTEAELRGVLGMSEELYGRLRPFVTVYSGAEGIDPTRASPDVLRAVPGMTPELADAIREVGPDGDPFEVIEDEGVFDLELYFVPSREIMFRVQAEARTPGGGVFVREAVIELALQPERPFMVHVWRRGALP